MHRFKARKWWFYGSAALLVLLVAFGVVAARKGNGAHETFVVLPRGVIENVRLSGTVEASIVSDLGFEASGVVRDVNVEVNDMVGRGQTLASLRLGTLAAELQSAQAAVALKQAQTSNTGINLDAITEKQDTLVQNARIELYSDDLVAEPHSTTYTQTPPVISGRYTGGAGTYKLVIRNAAQKTETELNVFGMEETEPVEVSKTGPTPLGENGLFVTFPDGPAAHEGTTWYVAIPNTKSSSYAANFSAYQEAGRERERALEEARADLREQSEGSSVASAELAQARAEVARIEALIAERVLRAPFSGMVTAVHIDPGEAVTSGTIAIALIGGDAFGVEVDLPEIDSIKVRTGNEVTITLDAWSETSLSGTVVSVNRTETVVDGVSVYEARIAFDDENERIISGMTADVAIITGKREDVLALPARAVRYREDGTAYVLVQDPASGDARETEIVLGLRGSDGFFEVSAGIEEADLVLISRTAQ